MNFVAVFSILGIGSLIYAICAAIDYSTWEHPSWHKDQARRALFALALATIFFALAAGIGSK